MAYVIPAIPFVIGIGMAAFLWLADRKYSRRFRKLWIIAFYAGMQILGFVPFYLIYLAGESYKADLSGAPDMVEHMGDWSDWARAILWVLYAIFLVPVLPMLLFLLLRSAVRREKA